MKDANGVVSFYLCESWIVDEMTNFFPDNISGVLMISRLTLEERAEMTRLLSAEANRRAELRLPLRYPTAVMCGDQRVSGIACAVKRSEDVDG